MRSKTIDRIIISNTNPHNNNTLWVDTSNGEKNAVLKYKGKTIVGGNTNNNAVQQGQNTIDNNYGVLPMYIPSVGTYNKTAFEIQSGITKQDLIDAANGLYRWVRVLPQPMGPIPAHGEGVSVPAYSDQLAGTSSYDLPIISSPNYSANTFTIGAIDYTGIWNITCSSTDEYTVTFTQFGS